MVKAIEGEKMKWTKAVRMGLSSTWVPVVSGIEGVLAIIEACAFQTRALTSLVEDLIPQYKWGAFPSVLIQAENVKKKY